MQHYRNFETDQIVHMNPNTIVSCCSSAIWSETHHGQKQTIPAGQPRHPQLEPATQTQAHASHPWRQPNTTMLLRAEHMTPSLTCASISRKAPLPKVLLQASRGGHDLPGVHGHGPQVAGLLGLGHHGAHQLHCPCIACIARIILQPHLFGLEK